MTSQPMLDLRDVVLGTGYQLFTKTIPKLLLEIGVIMAAWRVKHGTERAVITLSSDLSDSEPTVKAAHSGHEVVIARAARGNYVYVKERQLALGEEL